jgi:hypothetical protein
MDYILGNIRLFGRGYNTQKSSEFSHFFRNASSGEKKKVFMEVAKKASKDQQKVLKSSTKK